MRKRSKYRPKPQYPNPVAAVLEKIAPVSAHENYLTTLLAKNHDALRALIRGEATRDHMDILIGAVNVVEGLWRMKGLGAMHEDRITDGFNACKALCERHKRDGRVTVRANELEAMNALMELHDAQLACITVQDMDDVLTYIRKEEAAGRTTRIISSGM